MEVTKKKLFSRLSQALVELTEAAVTSQVQAPTKAHLTDRLLSEGGGTLRLRHRLSHSDVHSRQPQRDTGVQRNQG